MNDVKLVHEVLGKQTLKCGIRTEMGNTRKRVVGDPDWQSVDISCGQEARIGAVRNEMQFKKPVPYRASIFQLFESDRKHAPKGGQMVVDIDLRQVSTVSLHGQYAKIRLMLRLC